MEQKRRDNKAIRQTGIDASTRRAHARTRRRVPFRGSRRDERIRDGECRMTSSDHVARGGKKKRRRKCSRTTVIVVPASSITMGALEVCVRVGQKRL